MSHILMRLLFVQFCSPGVIKTDVHRRGGMNDEQYAQVREIPIRVVHLNPLWELVAQPEGGNKSFAMPWYVKIREYAEVGM